jgi:Delta7-sterol 5-desaturase
MSSYPVMSEFFTQFGKNYIGAVTAQFTILTLLWLIVWKWIGPRVPAARIQPKSNTGGKQMRREIKNGLIVLAFSTGLGVAAATFGDFDRGGAGSKETTLGWIIWSIVSIPLLLFINDSWFYFVHRILHSDRIYKLIHNEHHKSLDTTPFTVLSFHFLEPVLLVLWVIPVMLFLPVHILTMAVVNAYGFFDNVKAHLGYEFFPAWFNRGPFRWLTTSTYHNMHHKRFKGNYGLHFRFWDRILGTEIPEYDAEFDGLVARRREAKMARKATASAA